MFTNSLLATEIHKDIENYLASFGIFFRCFSRVKETHSLEKKLEKRGYSKDGKKMQDAIGIRIILYFPEDIDSIVSLLEKKFDLLEATIDEPTDEEFSPTRCNLIFNLPERKARAFSTNYQKYDGAIDTTYEVQIRTIFSEGWHEIEHDLRYKCKENWENHKDLSRTLNGISAALIASEWSLERIFDDLSYRFYKSQEWEPMLKNKIRLRFDGDALATKIAEEFTQDTNIAKHFFRMEKAKVLKSVAKHGLKFPMNLNNIIYFYNALEVQNDKITAIAPEPLLAMFKEAGIGS
jgi:ppGpp synthetase/RelA/SpoT-type nucleotidyltranferase